MEKWTPLLVQGFWNGGSSGEDDLVASFLIATTLSCQQTISGPRIGLAVWTTAQLDSMWGRETPGKLAQKPTEGPALGAVTWGDTFLGSTHDGSVLDRQEFPAPYSGSSHVLKGKCGTRSAYLWFCQVGSLKSLQSLGRPRKQNFDKGLWWDVVRGAWSRSHVDAGSFVLKSTSLFAKQGNAWCMRTELNF